MEHDGVQKDESASWKTEEQLFLSLPNEVARGLIVFQYEVLFVWKNTIMGVLPCSVFLGRNTVPL